MYYSHFGLLQPPYKITPDIGAFYQGAYRGDILNALVFAIKNGEAITKVVGEVGSGKTMICRMLQEKLPKHIEIAYLSNPNLPADDVLPAIALELGIPLHENDSRNRLYIMKALEKYLLVKHANNQQVVVLVEEAQCMPLESLEEIRLLSNLETHQHKLLQVVLFGQPELDDNLSARSVRQIKDRITHSLYLPPIKLHDIREYLVFRLEHAGYTGPNLFSDSAVWLIARFSKGLIRRINILADKALLSAYAQDSKIIRWNHVLAAYADIGFDNKNTHYTRHFLSIVTLATILATSVYILQFNNPSSERVSSSLNLPPFSGINSTIKPFNSAEYPKITDNKKQASLFLQRRKATNLWLRTSRPTDYSVQLLLANADATQKIEKFLRQTEVKPYLNKIYISKSMLNNKVMFNVLYGQYSSFSSANTFIKNLPQMLVQSQPYIRNISDIQANNGI